MVGGPDNLVRIAGAGLAGMFAALRLASRGFSVEVVDVKSKVSPSSGPHTEALRNYMTEDAMQELRRYGFDLNPFGRVETTVRRSANFQNVLRGPAYYLFMRGQGPESVDNVLYQRCLDLGVRFRFKSAKGPGTPLDIVATGPPPDAVNMIGAGFTFSEEGSNLDSKTVYALLDNDVAPGGYLVISPGLGFHSIYSVSWPELRYEELIKKTEAATHRQWIREILGSSRRIGKIYGRAYYSANPIANAERDDGLYIGEAGGFQDAIAGFGFRYAVVTASLAADSILEKSIYPELLSKKFGDEFLTAFASREKLNRFTNDDFDRLVDSLGRETDLEEYKKLRQARFF